MTMPILTKAVIAAAMVSAFSASGATTYDFGVLTTTKSFSDISVLNTFDDEFKFTVGPQSGVLGGVVGLDLLGDLSVQYRIGMGSTPIWGAWTASSLIPSDVDTGAFSYSQTLSGLSTGQTDWFGVKGTATKASYSVTLAPVPEPETYALLISGLALMGTIARRRKVIVEKTGA
jgi:hypothetical protein